MFESFSKGYESFFRVVTIIWVVMWTFINASQTITQYFTLYNTDKDIQAQDILGVILNWITIIVGIALVGLMIAISNRIEKKKIVKSLPILGTLGVVYYLFKTFMDLIITVMVKSDSVRGIQKELLFNTIWIIPSIILLVCHFVYIVNVSKYNQELTESTTAV
jgi:Na+/melibiose symporter-like transporter